VFTLKLFVTITTNVPPILVIQPPENVSTKPFTVTTAMHVLLTAVTEILVCAYISQRTVTITTHVPKILATPEPENVSLKISLLKSPQLALTDVSSQNVIQLKDLFKLHLSANLETNVPRLSVTQQEDVSPLQSFVTNLQEELSTNVTQTPEFVNVLDHLVTITIHVLLTHMLRVQDVLTFKNVNLTTCVSFQNVTRHPELAHMKTRTVMMETHVLMILAIQFWENVSTPQENAIAHLETLDHVTQLADNVNTTQLVELTLIVVPDFVIQRVDASINQNESKFYINTS